MSNLVGKTMKFGEPILGNERNDNQIKFALV